LPRLACNACAHFHVVNERECAGSVPPVVRVGDWVILKANIDRESHGNFMVVRNEIPISIRR
jgi:hypothetical protein